MAIMYLVSLCPMVHGKILKISKVCLEEGILIKKSVYGESLD